MARSLCNFALLLANVRYDGFQNLNDALSLHLNQEAVAAAVGIGAQNRSVGVFQIDVFDPVCAGDGPSRTEAERIVAVYKRGTILTNTGVSLIVEKAYRGPATTEGDWFQTPVIIEWRADVAN
jgi:hypothetical protein